jgi:DNA-binding beta-propeller fold protein YncE
VDSFAVEGTVREIAFNPAGTIATVANEYGYVDFLTAPTITTPPAPPHAVLGNGIHGAAISAGGEVYVTVYTGSRVPTAVLPSFAFANGVSVNAGPLDVAFNSTGTRAYVASSPVSVVDVAAGRAIASFAMGAKAVTVSPGDSVVWLASDAIYGIQASTGMPAHTVQFQGPANFMVARDSQLYVSEPETGKVIEVSTRGDSVQQTFVVGGRPQGIALAPAGDILYVANENHELQFWDVVHNADLGSVPLAGAGFGIARHPVTGRLYVGDFNGQVEVFDAVTRAKVDSFMVGGRPRHIAFNANGSVAVVANESGWVDFLQP